MLLARTRWTGAASLGCRQLAQPGQPARLASQTAVAQNVGKRPLPRAACDSSSRSPPASPSSSLHTSPPPQQLELVLPPAPCPLPPLSSLRPAPAPAPRAQVGHRCLPCLEPFPHRSPTVTEQGFECREKFYCPVRDDDLLRSRPSLPFFGDSFAAASAGMAWRWVSLLLPP